MTIKSSKPRRQRFFRFNADMHERQHFVHAHLDKPLRQRLGIKTRAVQISKGDTVRVVAGGNRGKTGKVTLVSMRRGSIFIDALKKKNARGKEYSLPVSASNVYITDLNLSDRVRAAKLKVKVVAEKKERPAARQEPKRAPGEKAAAEAPEARAGAAEADKPAAGAEKAPVAGKADAASPAEPPAKAE